MYQEKSGNPGRPICSAEQTPLTHIETIRISKESAVGKGIEILKLEGKCTYKNTGKIFLGYKVKIQNGVTVICQTWLFAVTNF
jgi:hypothetical protein